MLNNLNDLGGIFNDWVIMIMVLFFIISLNEKLMDTVRKSKNKYSIGNFIFTLICFYLYYVAFEHIADTFAEQIAYFKELYKDELWKK